MIDVKKKMTFNDRFTFFVDVRNHIVTFLIVCYEESFKRSYSKEIAILCGILFVGRKLCLEVDNTFFISQCLLIDHRLINFYKVNIISYDEDMLFSKK